MLHIDISFALGGQIFDFKKEVCCGQKSVFQIGEKILADKLFYVLTGLDKNFKVTVFGEEVNFSAGPENNVLALGDRSMFIKGSVKRNIYRALRARTARNKAKEQTEFVIREYNLSKVADESVKNLDDEKLLRVALARAHFRNFKLIVANCFETYIKNTDSIENCFQNSKIAEKNFTSFKNAYIIEII